MGRGQPPSGDPSHKRRAASAWLARNPWAAGKTLRADAVFLSPRRWPRHEANIFDLAP